jgi:hypothetical protein
VGTECLYASPGSIHKVGTVISAHAKDPGSPLEYISTAGKKPGDATHATDVLLILKDFDFFLGGSGGYPLGRAIKDLRDQLLRDREDRTTIIALGVSADLPARLEKVLTVIDFDLPTEDELTEQALESLMQVPGAVASASVLASARMAGRATAGLTATDAGLALAMSIANAGGVDTALLLAEKKAIIRRSGLLEYYEGTTDLAEVGGLKNLKNWLKERGGAFSEEAKKFGLPAPKALMLLGTPGTGKSLVAKTIGRTWGMPVLRLDIGSMFGSLVGESEGRMRRALQVAEAVAPCILFIDEVEKALGRGGGNDGGTTSRLFGNFLTWLSDKTAPVFVVCTANGVGSLPPEFLRAGRFDAIFMIDLPTKAERAEICRVMVSRYKRNVKSFTLDAVVEVTEGFSGAEIESSFVSAMYAAFSAGTEVTTDGWVAAARKTIPLSSTMGPELEELRKWAASKAIPANEPPEAITALATRPAQAGLRRISRLT